MKKLKITILYDDDELETLDSTNPLHDLKYVTDIKDSLVRLGHDVTVFNVTSKTIYLLKDIKTDLFFNLLEGYSDLSLTVYGIVSYVETLGIPMTGNSALALFITTDKARTKEVLTRNKIKTANFQLFINEHDVLKENLNFPLIVKPNFSDASEGISQTSVVENENELREKVKDIKENFKSASIAEEFIEGREYELLCVVVNGELRILPAAEQSFKQMEDKKWKMQDFNSKWDKNDTSVVQVCPAEIEEYLLNKMKEITHKVKDIFELTGYFRVDFRVTTEGTPYVIEVNANPDPEIWEDGNIPQARAAGLEYHEFIQLLTESAFPLQPEIEVKSRSSSKKKAS